MFSHLKYIIISMDYLLYFRNYEPQCCIRRLDSIQGINYKWINYHPNSILNMYQI